MDETRRSAEALDRGLAAAVRLLSAADLDGVAAAAIDWIHERFGAEGVGIVFTSGTRVAHQRCRCDDDDLSKALIELLLEVALQSSADVVDTPLPSPSDDGTPARRARIYPLAGDDGPLGALGFIPREQSDGTEVDLSRVAEVLAIKRSSMRETNRLRREVIQTKRWFDTLDNQLRVLDRERQKLSAVVNQSDTLMIVVDLFHTVKWANAAMAGRLRQSLGRNPIGCELQAVWQGLDATLPEVGSAFCPAARAFREGIAVHAESAAHSNGKTRALYLTFLPIRTPQGDATELLVMIQDLSDLEMLRRSETRYRTLFEKSPDAMMMVEPDTGRIILGNAVAARMTGYGAAELEGLRLEEIHDPDDWPAALHDYAAVMTSDRTASGERRLRTRDGDELTAEVTAMRFDLDGRAVTFVEFRDVTTRKRLEEEVRHSQKMEAVGQLAGGVAHDFNNILTVLMGEAEMLAGMPDTSALVRETAVAIGRETRRAALLTRKLLAISRKEVITMEVIDLNDVIQEVEDLLRPLLGESTSLDLRLCPRPCPVRADRTQLEQVLINLAVNARDAMPGGGRLWVEAEQFEWPAAAESNAPDRTARGVCLTLQDEGMGMDGPTSERLFEPFFTTKPPGEGTGLGLTTVRRIVGEHGGTIEVDSSLGEGTCFRIRLPLVTGEIATPTPSDLPVKARAHERILLVEDRGDLRKMAARALRHAGYDVVPVGSGEDALPVLQSSEEPFDLLLTDVVLTQMTGGEVAAAAVEQMPTIQILYMSGYAEDDVVRHGVSTAKAAFLAKPFSTSRLLNTVRKVLDAKRG